MFNEKRINILIEASSQEVCLNAIKEIKEKYPSITISEPRLTALSSYTAWGHYTKDN